MNHNGNSLGIVLVELLICFDTYILVSKNITNLLIFSIFAAKLKENGRTNHSYIDDIFLHNR